MNEEEKKAIKMCRLLLNGEITLHIIDDDGGTAYAGAVNKTYNDDLQTVLNLIKKQQAEIETLKKDFEIIDHECSRLEKEDIKKDLLINMLAEQLTTPVHSKELVIDYYKKEISSE